MWALILKDRRSFSSSSLSMVPKKDPKSSQMGQSPLSQLLTGNTSPGDFLEMSTSSVIITLACPGLLCYLYPQINATLCSVPLGIESEGDQVEVQPEACDAKPVYQAIRRSYLQAFCAEDSGYEIDALLGAEFKAEAYKA